MPVRYLSDPELARLSGSPGEIADEDAVTLSALPWLGWIPDDLAGCPPVALDRLAQVLAIAPDTSGASTAAG